MTGNTPISDEAVNQITALAYDRSRTQGVDQEWGDLPESERVLMRIFTRHALSAAPLLVSAEAENHELTAANLAWAHWEAKARAADAVVEGLRAELAGSKAAHLADYAEQDRRIGELQAELAALRAAGHSVGHSVGGQEKPSETIQQDMPSDWIDWPIEDRKLINAKMREASDAFNAAYHESADAGDLLRNAHATIDALQAVASRLAAAPVGGQAQ